MGGARFTWTNKQDDPVLVNLDRILVSVSWENNFPLANAWSMTRVGSDHVPIILDDGVEGQGRPKYFFFEQQWLMQPGFCEDVENRWKRIHDKVPSQEYSMNKWHSCLVDARQFMRGRDLEFKGGQNRE